MAKKVKNLMTFYAEKLGEQGGKASYRGKKGIFSAAYKKKLKAKKGRKK